MTFLLLVSSISAKNSDLALSNAEKKKLDKFNTGKNINKNARELRYFRLPWLPPNYDRWSPSKINRTELTAALGLFAFFWVCR